MHTFHPVDSGSVFRAQSASDEHVTAEQRHFDFLFAIAPAMHLHGGGNKRFHALIA
jgi:hypothetical protein